MLKEVAPPVASAEILDELARHMRVSSDMAIAQQSEMTDAWIAGVAHLEAALGLCLFPRSFVWRTRFETTGGTRAAIAPVRALTSVSEVDDEGNLTSADLASFVLRQTETRTIILSPELKGCEVEIVFDAGFGPDWADAPADLRRAALMLASHFFDERHAAGGDRRETVHAVAALVQPWRPVRVGLGRG